MVNLKSILDSYADSFADFYDYDESDSDESDFYLTPLAASWMMIIKMLKRHHHGRQRHFGHHGHGHDHGHHKSGRKQSHRHAHHHKKKSHHPVHWGYQHSEANPSDWHKHFPNGCGLSQSPIDLKTESATIDLSLKPIEVHYPHGATCISGGHNIAISSQAGNTLKGANLQTDYKLVQFHFHWGAKNGCGSEHKIDGKQADAELHFVHMKSHFKEFKEALQDQNGLSVLGVMLHEDNSKAKGVLMPLLKHFADLKHHKKIDWPKDAKFDFESMLPDLKHFMTYHGSLTTPPLTECVHWLVATNPLYITSEELATFRNLQTVYGEQCFIDNFRPCQPNHGRTVLRNF